MLKANAILLVFYLLFNADYAATGSNTSVIEIPFIQPRLSSSGTSNEISYFYTKFQELNLFEAASVSPTFVKVPGLSLAVNHNQPMLYRIEFQGACQSGTSAHNFIHVLIDGRVLIENELLPNNDQRQVVAPHLGTSIDEVDSRSSGLYMGRSPGEWINSCPRFGKVLLPSGTHSIDVGVRVTRPTMNLIGGQLDVEISTYDPTVQVGLSYPIIR
jgi:hypothetical protein